MQEMHMAEPVAENVVGPIEVTDPKAQALEDALALLDELIDMSMAPALLLMPFGMRRELQDKASEFKEAMRKCSRM